MKCNLFPDVYGDPNNPGSLEKLTVWEPFKQNQGRLLIRNDDVIPQHKGRKIEMESKYMNEICEMWDDVDVYLKIWISVQSALQHFFNEYFSVYIIDIALE